MTDVSAAKLPKTAPKIATLAPGLTLNEYEAPLVTAVIMGV
jgi:hypothetical protein